MHPQTLQCYEAALARGQAPNDWPMKIMAGPHHFHVTQDIFVAVTAMARQELQFEGVTSFPSAACLPANEMVLTFDQSWGTGCLLLAKRDGWICAYDGSSRDPVETMISFLPGSRRYSFAKALVDQHGLIPVLSFAVQLAMTLSAINHPRIVEVSHVPAARPHRRRVERVTGRAASAWSSVSWALGGKTSPKFVSDPGAGHPKALHWCRGHWRTAEPGQPNAEFVKMPGSGKSGWYVWVKDHWRGHPLYGIKLQHHNPHMPGAARSKRADSDRLAILPATKLAALSAAQRQAMVAAGYAPTATLH